MAESRMLSFCFNHFLHFIETVLKPEFLTKQDLRDIKYYEFTVNPDNLVQNVFATLKIFCVFKMTNSSLIFAI